MPVHADGIANTARRQAVYDAVKRAMPSPSMKVLRFDELTRLDKGWLAVVFVESPGLNNTATRGQRVVRLRDDLTCDWNMMAD
jgi:hypothetical protein